MIIMIVRWLRNRGFNGLAPNRVLGRNPPEIDSRENYLPRITRSTLAQLRSGFCSRLNSYQFKIGRSDSDLCPECGTTSHTSNHLFACPSHPTDLVVEDLWTNTWAIADFVFSSVFQLLARRRASSSPSTASPASSSSSSSST